MANPDYIRGLERAAEIASRTYKGSVVADKIRCEIMTMALLSEKQQNGLHESGGGKQWWKSPRIILKRLTLKDLFGVFR